MHFCQNRFNRFFFLNMEMMTIQRLKMSILVFFQVLIFVALSLVCVFMMTSASVKSPSLGKSTTENSSFFSNYAPPEVEFSRLSRIDCAKPFFEIRPGTRYFELISISPQWYYAGVQLLIQ